MQYSNFGSRIGEQASDQIFKSNLFGNNFNSDVTYLSTGTFGGEKKIGGPSRIGIFRNDSDSNTPVKGMGYNNNISQLGTYKFPRSMIQKARNKMNNGSGLSDLSKYGFQSVAT
tara:strand:+ start:833 stop:1174 length:342 start_codon:yes stop_codon:yes gene_type:complete